MSDLAQLDEIRRLFAELTAAFEDAAGVAARGQGIANLDDARMDHERLVGLCAQLAELMVRLEAQLK